MSHPPLLSICIPTYARAKFLRETLESVLGSLAHTSAPIEILVSDNASPDDTQAILAEFRNRWPALKVFRNPENIGEMNFYTTIHRGTGRYIWLLGDDDLVDPSFLPTVVRRLEEEPELIVCNYSVHSQDFSKVYRKAFHHPSIAECITSRDDVLAAFGIALGFISAGIVKREMITAVPREVFEQFSVYGLSFFTSVCTGLAPGCRAEFIREPLLRYRGGNTAEGDWWERVFIDGVGASLGRLAEIGYSPAAIRRAKGHSVRRYLIPRLSQLKCASKETNSLMAHAARVFSDSPEFKFLAKPLAGVPAKAFSLLRWLRRRVP